MSTSYDEVIEFLSGGMTPQELITFRPSAEANERFEGLIAKEKKDCPRKNEMSSTARWKSSAC